MTRQDLVAAVILTASLATWAAMCSAPARAATEPTVRYVVDLASPALEVPEAWAEHAGSVIQCESRWRAAAVSPTGDYGLFQLNRRWQEQRVNAMGYQWTDVLNPRVNATVAIAIWESWGRSWGAWACKP